MHKLLPTLVAAFGLIATAPPSLEIDTVDAIAKDYVGAAVEAKSLNPDLISINSPALTAAVEKTATKPDPVALAARSGELIARLDALPKPEDSLGAMRMRSLRARLVSLQAHLQVMGGAKLPIGEQVERFYGFKPDFRSLSSYVPALDRLDKAIPGPGVLAERIAALKTAALVPPDKIEPVFLAALAECRRRTALHMKLPEPESVEVQFLPDLPAPAEDVYQGNGKSRARINLDSPVDVDRLLAAACHETYPGHHSHFVNLDDALVRGRGWHEFDVEIEDGPQFPVAESVAEYGVGLTFPVEERIAFQRDVLYPLAGLKMQNVDAWRAYISARPEVLGASATVARDYLSGAIDQPTAQNLFVRYRLQTPTAAVQMMKMLDAFGSLVIASDFGWYTMDRAMQGKSVDEQWRLFRRIEREPMLLEDVAALR
ncbi:MAG: hypothetical protein HOP96_05315 [Sphingomonas sp.]|nr:hypothetical protein [Sphingomonas sp.]